jgi:hypothetical protein
MQHITEISRYQMRFSSLEEHLKLRGHQSMSEIYMELNPSLCEPPYTIPVHTVV